MLGHPIAHSLSPALHRAAYRALGLDWLYEAVDTTEEQLPAVVARLDGSWAGLSVTMPLKVAVMDLVHVVEPLAEVVGAVNTVLVSEGGAMLVGANTDVYGIVAALREGYARAARAPGRPGAAPADQRGPEEAHLVGRAAVIGAGATAASALAALGELGQPSPAVHLRSMARAGSAVRAGRRMGVTPELVAGDPAPAVAAWRDADTVVCTLPPHAADPLAAALLESGAPVQGVLLDCAYDPRTTALAAAWRGLGGTVVGGERMLLHQATEQVRLMTGRPAPLEAMSDALEAALAPRGSDVVA